MSDTPRAQLIHIDVDRRLGHEWDEWDGKPLPNRGNYDSPPTLFFAWSALALVVGLGLAALALFLLAPGSPVSIPRSRACSGAALAAAARRPLGSGGASSSFPMSPAGRSCPSAWPSGAPSSG